MYCSKDLALGIMLIMAISGCAMHAPMSEMVMFHEKESDGKSYSARYSHAIGSFTVEKYIPSTIMEYARETKPLGQDASYIESATEVSLSTNAILMFQDSDRFAISGVIGLPTGFDMTVKLPEKSI